MAKAQMSYRNELIQVAAVALAAIQAADLGSTEIQSRLGCKKLNDLLDDVAEERLQQEDKWGAQHHPREWWLTILMEEVGEAARAVLESRHAKKKS